MRWLLLIGASACLLGTGTATAETSPPSGSHELKKEKEEKGALRQRVDPAKDIAVQKANVKRLEHNAEVERKNGNRVGAWAAERDAKHARKLLKEDEKRLRTQAESSRSEEKSHRE